MGGCASRPKKPNSDSLPGDKSASYEQMIKAVSGDPTAEVNPLAFTVQEQICDPPKENWSLNSEDVGTEKKENPSLDTLEPKKDASNSAGESKVEPDISIKSLVPETGGSNPESVDSEKVSEAVVEASDLTQESETAEAVLVQKWDVEGDEAAPNSEGLKKQDVEKHLLSD